MLWITSIHYEIMTWLTPSLVLLLQTLMKARLNCCLVCAAGKDLGKKQTTNDVEAASIILSLTISVFIIK